MERKQLFAAGELLHPETDAEATLAVDTYNVARGGKGGGGQQTLQVLLDAIAEKVANQLLGKAEVAGWAKQPVKPSYSAEEVGADGAGSSAAALLEAKEYVDGSYRQSTAYTDQKIADLIKGAPNTLDTLGKIAAAMMEDKGVVEALEAAIGSKASDVEYQAHASNAAVHVTASKQEKWDGYGQRIEEAFQSASNGKRLVASAITGKGINTAADAEFQTMAENIGRLQLPSGNAAAAQVLSGYTFSNASGVGVVGAMPNRGAVTVNLNAGGTYTIPAGCHNGAGKVTAAALSTQTSATAIAGNITAGKTAWVNGKKVVGTGADNTAQYNAGVAAADARANPSSTNYRSGYNAGVAEADARANPASTNYKSGYNAGVVAADARANPASANYMAGYNAGRIAGKQAVTIKFYEIDGRGTRMYLNVAAYTRMTAAALPGVIYYLKDNPNASNANQTGNFRDGSPRTIDISGYTTIGLWFDGSYYSGGTQEVTFE